MKKIKKVKLPRSVHRLFPQVAHVTDATKAVEVSVTKKDCNSSEPLNPTECALARATRNKFHADAVIIGMSSSYIIKGDKAIRYATPESVRREIVSFDRHKDFAPGDYHLVPKAPSSQFGPKRVRDREPGKGVKVAKRKIHHSARVRVLVRGVE